MYKASNTKQQTITQEFSNQTVQFVILTSRTQASLNTTDKYAFMMSI